MRTREIIRFQHTMEMPMRVLLQIAILVVTFLQECRGIQPRSDTPLPELQEKEFLRVCYYPSWAADRTKKYTKVDINQIDPKLCTHLVYAFAKLDLNIKSIRAYEPDKEEGSGGRYQKFNDLKKTHSHLKTMLSIGGEYAGNSAFVAISKNDATIQTFAQNAVRFLRERNFDGLDVDWEYPNADTKTRFVKLLKGLQKAFVSTATDKKLLLSIAGAAGKWTLEPGFDIAGIAKNVDFVNVMTYDYHVAATNSLVAGFNSPLYSRLSNTRFHPSLSTNWTVHFWMEHGLPASKVVVGVTGMGRRFVLNHRNQFRPGATITMEARKGELYEENFRLGYPEICMMMGDSMRYFDKEQGVPYLVNGDNWVGYEDAESLKKKVKWMEKLGLAGIMFWALDQDDFTGEVCDEGKYPLLTAINEAIYVPTTRSEAVTAQTSSVCLWLLFGMFVLVYHIC